MTAFGPSAPARPFALELDVLRGFAGILMIVNHAGYRLLSADDAVHSGWAPAVFLGSVAPAVFFFATGFGIGLSRPASRRPLDWLSVLWKAMLLVVADQFFFWNRGASFGLDFFSFIAIATVAVSLISQLHRAVVICISLSAGLLAVRYLLAPLLGSSGPPAAIVEWLLGVRTVADVSYPLSPWMVFPLLGFACGFSYERVSLTLAWPRNQWLKRGSAVAAVCLALSIAFYFLNRGFFRWGTVSFAYFVFAVGVVVTAGLFAMAVVMYRRSASRLLALRGVASFAVIPLHYAMLAVLTHWLPQPMSLAAFAVATSCVIAASFFCSAQFASVVSRLTTAKHRRLLFGFLAGVVFTLCLAINFDSIRSGVSAELITMLAQLTVAGLLGLGLPKRRA
jgi:Heparan-alpha-glucosaminide N-acetyltransferase, catalytic